MARKKITGYPFQDNTPLHAVSLNDMCAAIFSSTSSVEIIVVNKLPDIGEEGVLYLVKPYIKI